MPTIAIILAGGLGTRARPIVADKPKVLAPVAGKPFLDYVLAYLASQKIKQVALCVGYLAEQVKSFARDGSHWGIEVRYSEETTPLGTGGALRHASVGLDDPFFALNGDTLFVADLEGLWLRFLAAQVAGAVALLPMYDGQQRGCVTLAENDKVVAFDEKPVGARDVLINTGVYVLAPQALLSVQPGQRASIERQVFPRLAADNQLVGHVQTGYFADIGTPESLAAFERDVIAGVIPVLK